MFPLGLNEGACLLGTSKAVQWAFLVISVCEILEVWSVKAEISVEH